MTTFISTFMKQDGMVNTDLNEYQYHITPEDTVTSPISSCETSSLYSRRSSYSSFDYTPRLRHTKSLLVDMYPTKKSAYERIEFLEEQIRLSRQLNQTIVKSISQSDQTFLDQRADPLDKPKDTETTILQKLEELKQLVHASHIDKVVLSARTIQHWIDSVTKQDLKNVMVPLLYATEQEKQKNARLTQAIHKLSQQKHTACKTIKQLKTKLAFCQRQYERETNQLRQKLKINKEEQQDMEQVVDDMQKEMQIMLDELDQTKRQKERFEEKSQRLEKDLQEDSPDHGSQALLRESHTTILQLESDLEQQKEKLEQLLLRTTQERNTMVTTHAQQVDALVLEKNELRARLVQAERSAAELNLLVTVERKKASDKELEDALKRTLAERDAALAKTQQEIMKLKQQADRLSQYNEKQIQREVVARLEELESNLKSTYKKETDTYQLQISREVRELSGRLVELEEELEGMERRQAQYDQQIENIKRSQLNAEEALRAQRLIWEKKEHQLKMEMTKSDQKIISLEKEALVLYSKNLDMARHLGELDLS